MVVVVAVQIGPNPVRTLVVFGRFMRERRLAAGRRDREKRFEEREKVRRVLATPPMAFSLQCNFSVFSEMMDVVFRVSAVYV